VSFASILTSLPAVDCLTANTILQLSTRNYVIHGITSNHFSLGISGFHWASANIYGNRESRSYFTTGGLPLISSSWRQAPWNSRPVFSFFQLNACGYSPYVTSSLTRGWVCRLQLLLVLTSARILGSESQGTRDHILLSQILDSPNLEGQVPVYISPRNRVAQLYPQALGLLFVASYNS
jgi:hypothetical protein